MMGRTHAATGAAVWLGGLAIAEVLGTHVGIPVDGASTLAAVAGSIAPDLDHPDSTIANAPGMMPVCAAVSHVAGGHRWALHSWPVAVAFGGVALLAVVGGPVSWGVAEGICAFLAARSLALLDMRRSLRSYVFGAVAGLLAAMFVHPGLWFGLAITVGMLCHDLEDIVTGGCAFGWPFVRHIVGGKIVGGMREEDERKREQRRERRIRGVLYPAIIVLFYVVVIGFRPPAAPAFSHHLRLPSIPVHDVPALLTRQVRGVAASVRARADHVARAAQRLARHPLP